MTKKPWHTKEWKEMRDKILAERNVCEAKFCRSKENLVIHHPNTVTDDMVFKSVWNYAFHDFSNLYNSVYPTKQDIKDFSVPHKGKKNEDMHRHDGCWNWHYVSTKHKNKDSPWFDDSNAQMRIVFANEYKEYNEKRWHNMWSEYKESNADAISNSIDTIIKKEWEKYNGLEDVQVLCKRCHFAHHKGMDLCPVCKNGYKKKSYNTCFDCIPDDRKKQILDDIKLRREYDDFLCDCDRIYMDKGYDNYGIY